MTATPLENRPFIEQESAPYYPNDVNKKIATSTSFPYDRVFLLPPGGSYWWSDSIKTKHGGFYCEAKTSIELPDGSVIDVPYLYSLASVLANKWNSDTRIFNDSNDGKIRWFLVDENANNIGDASTIIEGETIGEMISFINSKSSMFKLTKASKLISSAWNLVDVTIDNSFVGGSSKTYNVRCSTSEEDLLSYWSGDVGISEAKSIFSGHTYSVSGLTGSDGEAAPSSYTKPITLYPFYSVNIDILNMNSTVFNTVTCSNINIGMPISSIPTIREVVNSSGVIPSGYELVECHAGMYVAEDSYDGWSDEYIGTRYPNQLSLDDKITSYFTFMKDRADLTKRIVAKLSYKNLAANCLTGTLRLEYSVSDWTLKSVWRKHGTSRATTGTWVKIWDADSPTDVGLTTLISTFNVIRYSTAPISSKAFKYTYYLPYNSTTWSQKSSTTSASMNKGGIVISASKQAYFCDKAMYANGGTNIINAVKSALQNEDYDYVPYSGGFAEYDHESDSYILDPYPSTYSKLVAKMPTINIFILPWDRTSTTSNSKTTYKSWKVQVHGKRISPLEDYLANSVYSYKSTTATTMNRVLMTLLIPDVLDPMNSGIGCTGRAGKLHMVQIDHTTAQTLKRVEMFDMMYPITFKVDTSTVFSSATV